MGAKHSACGAKTDMSKKGGNIRVADELSTAAHEAQDGSVTERGLAIPETLESAVTERGLSETQPPPIEDAVVEEHEANNAPSEHGNEEAVLDNSQVKKPKKQGKVKANRRIEKPQAAKQNTKAELEKALFVDAGKAPHSARQSRGSVGRGVCPSRASKGHGAHIQQPGGRAACNKRSSQA